MPATRRSFLIAGTSALALVPLLAACGDDLDAVGEGTAVDAETDAFPVTITHKYGETTITEPPKRIVCLGLTDQDTLLALGIVPVAVTYWFGDKQKSGVYDWARDALGDAEPPALLEFASNIVPEKVAAFQPDLILSQYSAMTQDEYDKLSASGAKVVPPAEGYTDYGMPWDEAALVIGRSVGKPDAAQQLVDDVKQTIADFAEANPDFAGTTAVVATSYEGVGVYGKEDPRTQILEQLGFTYAGAQYSDSSEFYFSLSAERTTDLGELGTVVWLDIDADRQVRSLFESTEAYRQGRWLNITDSDGDYYVGHSFVTPLSIPWVLERYVPQLAAAADGDPATQVQPVTG